MKNLKNFIGGFAVLMLVSCNGIKLSEVPQCTLLSNDAICTIPLGWDIPQACVLVDEEHREYECSLSSLRAYQCTSPDGFDVLFNDVDRYLKELERLRRRCGDKSTPSLDSLEDLDNQY